MNRFQQLLAVSAMFPIFSPCARAQILGVTWTGDVVSINDATGQGTVIGNAGFQQINASAQDRNGRIVASAVSDVTLIPALIEIDITGGPASFLTRPFLNDIRALAFAPTNDDLMYAIDPAGSGSENKLYTLDLTVAPGDSAIKTLVGTVTLGHVQGMTFDRSGTLWGWSTSFGLITIDEVTCAAVDVDGTLDGSSDIQTLCFDPSGRLFGIGERVFSIDTVTGVVTPIGAPGTFGSVRGAEYVGPLGASYCFGDGLDSAVTALCPCGNFGDVGHGCGNSFSAGGGLLSVSGTTIPNTLLFTAAFLPNNSLSVGFRNTANASPGGAVFGDGIRCQSGTLIRFGAHNSGSGGDLANTWSSSTATVGSGLTRYYQVQYRNPAPTFCPPATFNITNGYQVTW